MPGLEGTRLGPYEVQALLGAGGMGEVYRARDQRLGRDVALKVLAGETPHAPERLGRFEQEARAVSALNHPNILGVFDVGTQDGTQYVVFELLEGETLRHVLRSGGLTAHKAVELAIQIARGLAAAHERGVVHRDLKPENLFLTTDGRIKILDFGVATLGRADGGETVADVATDRDETTPGPRGGTPSYMSPEQVRGHLEDQRSDIFSLGALLYEMLSRQRAFRGATTAETWSAILKEDPPELNALGVRTAPALERIVRRCLEKRREDRFHSAHDLALALEAVGTGSSEVAAIVPRPRRLPRRAVLAQVALGAVLGASLAAWLGTTRSRGTPTPVRFAIDVEFSGVRGGNLTATGRMVGLVALCPNGNCVAYRGADQGLGRLYLRAFDQAASTPLPGTEGASGPFFSPDGRWLGFFAEGRLKKLSIDGLASQVLCEGPDGWNGSWGRDGRIYFAATAGPLSRVSADGGAPEVVTRLDEGVGERSHRWPAVFPDGSAVLFESVSASGASSIVVQSLETGERRTLVESGGHPRLAPGGHLLFMKDEALKAVALDLKDHRVVGPVVDAVENAFGTLPFNVAGRPVEFDVSATGTLAWIAPMDKATAESRLWRVDRSGHAAPMTDLRRAFNWPRLSPNGDRLAVTIFEGSGSSIWLYDLSSRSLTRLTFDKQSAAAIWTPDGKRLTYGSNRAGPRNLFWEPADGAGPIERLTNSDFGQLPVSWSPDGRTLSFEERHPIAAPDIRLLPVPGSRTPRPLLDSPYAAWDGMISPDGRLVAYTSIESGRLEVYVRPLRGPGAKRQVSMAGGNSPVWARDGRELFYLNGEKMMAASVQSKTEIAIGNPTLLFEGEYELAGQVPNYDVTPDGRAFVMVRGDRRKPLLQVTVLLNGLDALERRAPHRR